MPKSKAIAVRCRWTESDARAVVETLADSGLAVTTFAQREGLDAQRLYRWRRRLTASPRVASPQTAFLEIRPPVATPVEIVLRSERVLRVAVSIDGEALLRLVELLEKEKEC